MFECSCIGVLLCACVVLINTVNTSVYSALCVQVCVCVLNFLLVLFFWLLFEALFYWIFPWFNRIALMVLWILNIFMFIFHTYFFYADNVLARAYVLCMSIKPIFSVFICDTPHIKYCMCEIVIDFIPFSLSIVRGTLLFTTSSNSVAGRMDIGSWLCGSDIEVGTSKKTTVKRYLAYNMQIGCLN